MTSDNFWCFLIPSTYNVWPFLSQSIPIDILAHDYFIWFYFDPHFLCWISRVAPFNTWLISNWEENDCCYKLSKCTKWHLFHSNWSKLSFWVKIYSVSKWNWLINSHYTTISGHLFATCMSIFQKNEVQTIILRCLTGLNLDWFKSYGLKCSLRPCACSANSKNKDADE
jgi:hypothetical protein